jgi:hypothetical protein
MCLVALLCGLLVAERLAAVEPTLPADEKAKIEKLIEHVKVLKDAVFIRNGVEYDAATAARFMQGKWDASAAEIRSAREFVEKAASKSSTTGKPYLIRLKRDGAAKDYKSGEYLLEQLKKLEQP